MPEQLWALWPWMHLAGRILFSSFFVAYGLHHLVLRPSEIAAYLERKQIPGPRPVAFATGVMLLAGGLMVLLGWRRFIGAGLLFLVTFPGAFALHPFWRELEPATRQAERAEFFMTLSLAGAALIVGFYGHTLWPMAVAN
jgi:uncharacterized membrane protein YphA (DoxX/SURF4 family)